MQDVIRIPNIRGRLSIVCGDREAAVPNQIQYGWGAAAARLMATGDIAYKISAMYIEFENVADGDDVVTAPTYARTEGQEYYENLILLPDRDFLRVPLLLPAAVSVEPGYEDHLPANEGNLLTFYTQSSGVVGYHGRTFSHTVNSKIFGAALVVTPDNADPTKDIVVARTYLNSEDQVLKVAARQVGMTWQLSLL